MVKPKVEEPLSASAIQVIELQAKIDALQAEMQDFTYTVSHDLRAPLRHIVSYAQLVREDAGPQLTTEVQGFLSTICDSAHTMGQMLDRLLELSRVGTASMHLEAVPLQMVVGQIVSELSQGVQAAQPHRTVIWNVATDMPTIVGDGALVAQALRQILTNAVQFSAVRKPAVISISTTEDASKGTVTLVVQDNGIGFPAINGDQLFQPFKRLHSARQGAGQGMGLALTRKVMERIGGTALAHGSVDSGCTVQLAFKAT
jgi:light-regulated signal transduction histidine kinase (bacteriophytochrome)